VASPKGGKVRDVKRRSTTSHGARYLTSWPAQQDTSDREKKREAAEAVEKDRHSPRLENPGGSFKG